MFMGVSKEYPTPQMQTTLIFFRVTNKLEVLVALGVGLYDTFPKIKNSPLKIPIIHFQVLRSLCCFTLHSFSHVFVPPGRFFQNYPNMRRCWFSTQIAFRLMRYLWGPNTDPHKSSWKTRVQKGYPPPN